MPVTNIILYLDLLLALLLLVTIRLWLSSPVAPAIIITPEHIITGVLATEPEVLDWKLDRDYIKTRQ